MQKRDFELLSTENDKELLPKRETEGAAGYDLKCSEEIVIQPGEIGMVKTGLKAYMQQGEVLLLMDRSSNKRKLGIVLINSVGVIDKDYYNNAGNEGHIMAQMQNTTNKPVTIPYGTRMVQGVFVNHLITDSDNASGKRENGFGSTNK